MLSASPAFDYGVGVVLWRAPPRLRSPSPSRSSRAEAAVPVRRATPPPRRCTDTVGLEKAAVPVRRSSTHRIGIYGCSQIEFELEDTLVRFGKLTAKESNLCHCLDILGQHWGFLLRLPSLACSG
ncbi:hypothetical protein AAHA92_21544 [Salvia divinorum]|uniref:Uncharacterized protein n=1 Tax=Salvia divinorum TaxID=28513 RepID=A0ABD1GKT6_SALDI